MLLANLFEQAGLIGEGDRELKARTKVVGRIKRTMASGNILALEDGIHDLEDLGLTDREIRDSLDPIIPEIMTWFDRRLQAGNYPNLSVSQAMMLLDHGIKWPQLAAMFTAHKGAVIKTLLKLIHDDPSLNDGIALTMVRDYVDALVKMGINWPELGIIRKSVMVELKKIDLDESTATERPEWFDGFADYLGDTNIISAVYTAKAAGVNVHNSPLLAAHLNSNKWYLLRYFERCVRYSFNGFEEIGREIKELQSLGVDWPELKTFWDDNKDQSMRQLLTMMKGYDEDTGFYTWQEVNALRNLGVKWPELDIVMRGALSMMDQKKDLDESAVFESNLLPKRAQNIVNRTINIIRAAGSYYIYTLRAELQQAGLSESTIADVFNSNKTDLLYAITQDIEHNRINDAVNAIGVIQSIVGYGWPEVANVVHDNLVGFKKFISQSIDYAHRGVYYRPVIELYNTFRELNLRPDTLKDISQLIKKEMLDHIKVTIKQNGFTRSVLLALEAIEQIGVKVDIAGGKIKDLLLSDFRTQVKEHGLERDAELFVKLIVRFGNAELITGMKSIIEENKPQVVRGMLKHMKSFSPYSVYPVMTTLQNLGFKWPELAVIERSISSLVEE